MTEVQTVTPLDLAVARHSVSAVAVAFINANGPSTIAQIAEFCAANGLQSDTQKVYASVQTLATHGKLDRGLSKGEYAPAGSVSKEDRAAALQSVAKVSKVTRAKKAASAVPSETYSNEQVFTYLIEALGEPRDFVIGESWGSTFALLGDASPEYMIERATLAAGEAPNAWTLTNIGPNSAVMFLNV